MELRIVVAPLLGLLLLCPQPPARAGGSFAEDFQTVLYRDSLETSAEWDVQKGELRLHSRVPFLAGSSPSSDNALAVALAGDFACVAGYAAGLLIADVSDPGSPVWVGALASGHVYRGVAVSGDRACLSRQFLGVEVVDIADPANPVLLGSVDTPGIAYGGLAMGLGRVFLADGSSGLSVVDLTDPANPLLTATLSLPGWATDVVLSGTRAFVAVREAGVVEVDVSNPDTPVAGGVLFTGGEAVGVDANGDLAVVADLTAGLVTLDISTVGAPVISGTHPGSDLMFDVSLAGDRAYVASYGAGMRVYDLTDPFAPVCVDSLDTQGRSYGVAVGTDHVFVADHSAGLASIQVSGPGSLDQAANRGQSVVIATPSGGRGAISPTEVGSVQTPGFASGVAIAGQVAFVADGTEGMQVVDLQDPAAPAIAGTWPTTATAYGLSTIGSLVFVANGTAGIAIVDVANPLSPTTVGSLDTSGEARATFPLEDQVYVADGTGGLLLVDASSPASPFLEELVGSVADARGVVAENEVLVALDRGYGIHLFSVRDADGPEPLGTVRSPGSARDVALSGDHAYVADGPGGLSIFNIADPEVPLLVATWPTALDADAVVVHRWHAFVGDGPRVIMLDVSQPGAPLYRGEVTFPESVQDLAASGDDIHVADGASGLRIVRAFDSTGGPLISSVRLRSEQSGLVAWEASADGGFTWQGVSPDRSWVDLAIPGEGLLWRSTHFVLGPDQNAICSQLAVEWTNSDDPPPMPPSGFAITPDTGEGARLSWNASEEADVVLYRVHRGSSVSFVPSPETQVHETAGLSWVDPGPPVSMAWYRISCVDSSGTESDFVSASNITSAPADSTPLQFALHPVRPNPFHTLTELAYDVPSPGGRVKMDVFDVTGRRVVTLLDGLAEPGRWSVSWRGNDSSGKRAAAGVYFVRFEGVDQVRTRKVVRLR
ncbi:MAG: FlgD immunoglobulin-like domain containing protein [Gemmatimonadota bacterium]|nr:FlgD immunoglobulin-like domain containing protein [Gemmatimonadota bacterium]